MHFHNNKAKNGKIHSLVKNSNKKPPRQNKKRPNLPPI